MAKITARIAAIDSSATGASADTSASREAISRLCVVSAAMIWSGTPRIVSCSATTRIGWWPRTSSQKTGPASSGAGGEGSAASPATSRPRGSTIA
jgi:hypothetical protein